MAAHSPPRPKISSVAFNTEVVDRLLFGPQDVDCPEMELKRPLHGEHRVLKGPGYIRRGDDGQLVFKLYATNLVDQIRFGEEWIGASTAGKLIDRTLYYRLTAKDYAGQVWEAKYILPSFTSGRFGTMVHGKLRELESKKTAEVAFAESQARLVFLEDIEIPCNASTETSIVRGDDKNASSSFSFNLARFHSCGFEFMLREETGELTVDIRAADKFPASLESRVIESLQFVLGQSLHCNVYEHLEGSANTIRIRPARSTPVNTSNLPPLQLRTVQAHPPLNCVWDMFDRYLAFVLLHDGPEWHPCSVHLHKAREATASSPDARALGISVAVEGVAKCLHGGVFAASPELKAAVTALKQFVSKWPGVEGWKGSASLQARLPGLIDQLTSVRAVDRLYRLVELGLIEERLVDAWKKLRNPMAHAEQSDPIERQAFYDRIMAATVLQNQLVFSAIGYAGHYTDYSVHGFPTREYRRPDMGLPAEAGCNV